MGYFEIAKASGLLAVLGWAPLLFGQLELKPSAEEVPLPEARTPLLDLDGLLDLEAPDPRVEIENDILEDEPPARPTNDADAARTRPVRELAGEPVLRGPIHEAFADPVQQAPLADKVIRKAPPASVQEVPPTITDDSRNMEWISGYWAWDMQAKEYVWVSGVWRKKPKDRVWIPGRWEDVDRGHQWVPGIWLPTADGVVAKKEILPLPPKSLEKGPTSPVPSEEHFWIPGTWERNAADEYVWRPGYWSRSQKNWVWVPDHYAWDPAGCVFVPGYWDYTWERRGTLYAPCTFDDVEPGEQVSYRPTQVIDADQWLLNLWMGPRSSSYYYGDYYDCMSRGYTPWYKYYGSNRGFYDPLYSYYRWQFPATYGVGLYGYLNRVHTHYGTHSALRPSVRFCPYDQLGSRGYGSLYGDVRGLSSLLNIDLFGSSRYGYGRRGYYDDYRHDRHYYDDHRYGNRSRDVFRGLPQSQRRNLDALGRDRNRLQSTPAPRVDTLGPVRRTGRDRPGQLGPARTSGNSAARANSPLRNGSVTRPNSARYSRPSISRPQGAVRSNASGATRSNPRPTVRARPTIPTRPTVQPRPSTKPRPSVQSRPSMQSRPAAQPKSAVRSRPSPGFSISSMKNSRNRADVQKQRAAMQNLIKSRKGKK